MTKFTHPANGVSSVGEHIWTAFRKHTWMTPLNVHVRPRPNCIPISDLIVKSRRNSELHGFQFSATALYPNTQTTQIDICRTNFGHSVKRRSCKVSRQLHGNFLFAVLVRAWDQICEKFLGWTKAYLLALTTERVTAYHIWQKKKKSLFSVHLKKFNLTEQYIKNQQFVSDSEQSLFLILVPKRSVSLFWYTDRLRAGQKNRTEMCSLAHRWHFWSQRYECPLWAARNLGFNKKWSPWRNSLIKVGAFLFEGNAQRAKNVFLQCTRRSIFRADLYSSPHQTMQICWRRLVRDHFIWLLTIQKAIFDSCVLCCSHICTIRSDQFNRRWNIYFRKCTESLLLDFRGKSHLGAQRQFISGSCQKNETALLLCTDPSCLQTKHSWPTACQTRRQFFRNGASNYTMIDFASRSWISQKPTVASWYRNGSTSKCVLAIKCTVCNQPQCNFHVRWSRILQIFMLVHWSDVNTYSTR